MIKDTEKFEELKILVYNLIKNASKAHPVKGKTICNDLNLSFRQVKKIISILREEYPIVAKETDGGGYWIAESKEDVINFIVMIKARLLGYDETIHKMRKHLDNDIQLDFNHIPFID